jgi:hypothetical protein
MYVLTYVYTHTCLSLIMMKFIFQWANIHIDCRRYEASPHHDFNFK